MEIFWLAPTWQCFVWHLLYPVGVHYSRSTPLFEITCATSRLRAIFASPTAYIAHGRKQTKCVAKTDELAAEVFNDLICIVFIYVFMISCVSKFLHLAAQCFVWLCSACARLCMPFFSWRAVINFRSWDVHVHCTWLAVLLVYIITGGANVMNNSFAYTHCQCKMVRCFYSSKWFLSLCTCRMGT